MNKIMNKIMNIRYAGGIHNIVPISVFKVVKGTWRFYAWLAMQYTMLLLSYFRYGFFNFISIKN